MRVLFLSLIAYRNKGMQRPPRPVGRGGLSLAPSDEPSCEKSRSSFAFLPTHILDRHERTGPRVGQERDTRHFRIEKPREFFGTVAEI